MNPSNACARVLGRGAEFLGTAFFIGADLLITCAHVVARYDVGEDVPIRYGGDEFETRLEYKEPRLKLFPKFPPPYPDIALLRSQQPVCDQPLVLCTELPPEAVDLYSYGFHLEGMAGGESQIFKYASLGHADEKWEKPWLLLRNGTIPDGYSGGPIWVAGEECIAGVVTFADDSQPGGGAFPAPLLVKYAPTLKEHFEMEPVASAPPSVEAAVLTAHAEFVAVAPEIEIHEETLSLAAQVTSASQPTSLPEERRVLDVFRNITAGHTIGSPSEWDQHFTLLGERADRERKRGQWGRADHTIQRALEDPRLGSTSAAVQARILRARAILALDLRRDVEEAQRIAEATRRLEGDIAQQRILESNIAAARGDLPGALSILRDEDPEEVIFGAGYAIQAKRVDDAIKALEALPESAKETSGAQRLLSIAHVFRKDSVAALAHARSAYQLAPEEARVRFVLGFVLVLQAFPVDIWPEEIVGWPQPLPRGMIINTPEISEGLDEAAGVFGALLETDIDGLEKHNIQIWRLSAYALNPKRISEAEEYAAQLLSLPDPNVRALPWSRTLDLKVDASRAFRHLENAIAERAASNEEVLIYAVEVMRRGNALEAERVLRENVTLFDSEFALSRWQYFLIESLIAQKRFSDAQYEASLLVDGREEVSLLIAQSMAEVTRDFEAIKADLLRFYEQTGNTSALVSLCEIAANAADWEFVLARADDLINIRSVNAARLAIYSAYNSGNNEAAARLADVFRKSHPDVVPADLIRIEALALERMHRPEALDVFKHLISVEPSESNILLYGQVLALHGDFTQIEMLSRRLDGLQVTAQTALNFSAWLALRNREAARRFWRLAMTQDVPDDYVLRAYMLARQLDLEEEFRPLMQRFQQLGAEQRGGIHAMTQSEGIETLRKLVRRNAEIGSMYRRGQIPVHFLWASTSADAVRTHVTVPTRNTQSHPRDWTPVYVRHGGRGYASVPLNGGTPLLDVTTYLLAERYELRDLLIESFGKVKIVDTASGMLSQSLAELAPMPEDRFNRLVRIERLVKELQIEELSDTPSDIPALYEMAAEKGGRVVDWLPRRETVTGEILEPQPEYVQRYGVSVRALVDRLFRDGNLSKARYDLAVSALGNSDSGAIGDPEGPGAVLGMTFNVPEVLEQAGVLDVIARQYKIVVQKEWIENLRREIRASDNDRDTAQWLETVIERLRRSVDEEHRIKSVGPGSQSEAGDDTPESRTLMTLITAPLGEGDVIACDDRFITQQMIREDGRPIASLYDLLVWLLERKKIETQQFYDVLQRMRADGLFYIPIFTDEILNSVGSAVVDNGDVHESLPMRQLRQYVAYALLDNDALFPSDANGVLQLGQMQFMAAFQQSANEAISKLCERGDPDDVWRANWIRENLSVAGLCGFGLARNLPAEPAVDSEAASHLLRLITENATS